MSTSARQSRWFEPGTTINSSFKLKSGRASNAKYPQSRPNQEALHEAKESLGVQEGNYTTATSYI